MYWKPGVCLLFFLSCAACIRPAQADGVTTYGVGLLTCGAYVKARDAGNANPQEIAFLHWLGGYFSGANKVSTHRNNALGFDGLEGVVSRLERYCAARPEELFASAVSMALYGARRGSPTHALDTVTYGAADRACETYLGARQQRDALYIAELQEYTNWLAGYLSGVNAASLKTTNILGGLSLADGLDRLQAWCTDHPLESFNAAVDALISPRPAQLASQDQGTVRH